MLKRIRQFVTGRDRSAECKLLIKNLCINSVILEANNSRFIIRSRYDIMCIRNTRAFIGHCYLAAKQQMSLFSAHYVLIHHLTINNIHGNLQKGENSPSEQKYLRNSAGETLTKGFNEHYLNGNCSANYVISYSSGNTR